RHCTGYSAVGVAQNRVIISDVKSCRSNDGIAARGSTGYRRSVKAPLVAQRRISVRTEVERCGLALHDCQAYRLLCNARRGPDCESRHSTSHGTGSVGYNDAVTPSLAGLRVIKGEEIGVRINGVRAVEKPLVTERRGPQSTYLETGTSAGHDRLIRWLVRNRWRN